MSWENFSVTGRRRPSLLFSARVSRKFLRTLSLSWAPMCFWSSATICCLSVTERVGAFRTEESLASFLKTAFRLSRALETGSRAEVLAAAVYCWFVMMARQRNPIVISLYSRCLCCDFPFVQPTTQFAAVPSRRTANSLPMVRTGARKTYQSAGVGAIDAVQGNGRPD